VLLLRSIRPRQRCLITTRANPSLRAVIESMTVDTLVANDRLKFIELIYEWWVSSQHQAGFGSFPAQPST
jgi:hypothetical protein